MYTQCPYCQTVFNIRAHDLSAARGMVRCGACQQAYDASQHLMDDLPLVPGEPLATPAGSHQITVVEDPDLPPVPIAEPPDLHHGGEAGGETVPDPVDESDQQQISDEESLDRLLDGREPDYEPVESEEKMEGEDGLFAIDTDLQDQQEGDSDDRSLSDEEAAWLTADEEAISLPEDDDPLADLMHDDPHLDSEIDPVDLAEVMADTREQGGELDPSLDLGGLLDTQEFDQRNRRDTPAEGQKGGGGAAKLSAAFAAINGALSAIPTPLWAVGTLLLFLAIPLQLLHQQSQWLVDNHPQLRQLIEPYCDITGCSVPQQRDVLAIALTERNVRSHPNHPQALLIEGQITNRAPFAQPYPLMEVVLSDQRGQPVALRRFYPIEYLTDPNLSGQAFPSRYTTTIELQVVDPGDNAVSFAFDFL